MPSRWPAWRKRKPMRNPLWSLKKRLARRASFPQLVRHEDANLILDPRNWIDNRIVAGVPYEAAQLAQARQLIATHRIDTFVDIGANFGLYTVLLGLLPQIVAVHAFEPVRRNYNQLCANIFANRLDAKVQAHCLALGEAAGQATIHVDPTSTGVSRLDLASTERDSAVFTQAETITLARGDDVLPLRGVALFAKIDVEGHAPAVLRGLGAFLRANRGAIQIEISPQESEAAELLKDAGWMPATTIASDACFMKL